MKTTRACHFSIKEIHLCFAMGVVFADYLQFLVYMLKKIHNSMRNGTGFADFGDLS